LKLRLNQTRIDGKLEWEFGGFQTKTKTYIS